MHNLFPNKPLFANRQGNFLVSRMVVERAPGRGTQFAQLFFQKRYAFSEIAEFDVHPNPFYLSLLGDGIAAADHFPQLCLFECGIQRPLIFRPAHIGRNRVDNSRRDRVYLVVGSGK